MTTAEEEQRKRDEIARRMTDAELQSALESQTHSGEWHKTALKEIYRRKKEKEDKEDRRQNRIEKETLAILILTILLVIITLRDCFH